jgi:hypothetical protein
VTYVVEERLGRLRNSRRSVMNGALSTFVTGLGQAFASPVFALSLVSAIVVAGVYHWAFARRLFARQKPAAPGPTRAAAPAGELGAVRERLDALEAVARRSLNRVGFVRFDAFPDVGSELSYALAVLDEDGNGFVLSSIYSREEVRTYAKAVRNFAADKELSDEERRALTIARDR